MNEQSRKQTLLARVDAAWLYTLLQHLRVDHRIKYKELANQTGLNVGEIYKIMGKKSLGTRAIMDKVVGYYNDNKIPLPDTKSNSNGAMETVRDKTEKIRGLDHILSELDLDRDRVLASVKLAGSYLLFSHIDDNKVRVTWIELKNATPQIPIPVFAARRPGPSGPQTIYQGFYYEHMTTLFLFGHIAKTPLSRSLVLVPAGSEHHIRDRHGVIAGASPGESLFTSTCFLKWIGKDVPWRRYKEILGERQRQDNDLRKYDRVLEFIQSRDDLASSIVRDNA